jgi:autotransporter passenger strand-loop-strand repeat protein
VNSGGDQRVNAGGTASVITVNSDGTEFLYGAASATTVNLGGTEYVFSGGTASSTTISGGGTEVVESDGLAISTSVALGGIIDVAYLGYVPGGTASVTPDDVLSLTVGGSSYTQQLAGTYAADLHFQLAPGNLGGTQVTLEVACYRSGTRILTDRGEVAVEILRVGDRVRTVLGGIAAPIIWIGRRDVDCARHPKPDQVWPVRIAAGAFGPGRPHTDLFLSPDHAVYVEDVLIPVHYLINGSTIAQVPVDRVTYHHIELSEHNVLLAEGLPAESFLDMRDGTNYANRPGPVLLYPDYSARMWEAFGCARLVVTGPELSETRALVAGYATAMAKTAGSDQLRRSA